MSVTESPRGSGVGYRAARLLHRAFGYGPVSALARVVAFWHFLFIPRTVASSMRFYGALFPEEGRWRRLVRAWRQVRSFATVFVDRLLLEERLEDRLAVVHEGLDRIVEAARSGAPTILWTTHLGNWEVAAHLLEKAGVPLTVVMAGVDGGRIEARQRELLGERGVRLVFVRADRDLGAVELVAALRRGEVVAVGGDRLFDGAQRSVRVEFLGRGCSVPEGPYALASLTGADIVPVFGLRVGARSYRFVAMGAVRADASDRGGRERAIRAAAAACFEKLETMVKEHPDQWYNFFDYWKTDG